MLDEEGGRKSAFFHESVVDLVGLFEEAPGLEFRKSSIDFLKPYIDDRRLVSATATQVIHITVLSRIGVVDNASVDTTKPWQEFRRWCL
jgi:hypothetical protein